MKFGLRKPSWRKSFGAYRSQWKRMLMRFFFPLTYGRKGWGWLRDPKKASYNWWYNRTTVSVDKLLGIKPADKRFGLFCCALASIFLFPFDFVSSGAKVTKEAHRERKERKASGSHNTGNRNKSYSGSAETTKEQGNRTDRTYSSKTSQSNSSRKEETDTERTTHRPSSVSSTTHNKTSTTKSSITPKSAAVRKPVVKTTVQPTEKVEEKASYTPYVSLFERETTPIVSKSQPEPELKEPDENTPKSTPKSEKDQYIRKRMIIAGSYYCNQETLNKLNIGSYFEVQPEPTNPHDKDAVVLLYDGDKIGYIAKQDRLPFVTCLKLRRNIYGVITNIILEDGRTKYEYETWFASK